MPQDNTAGLLIRLKGPPLSIFLAISRTNGMRAAALSAHTGWSRNATYDALRLLVAEGWVHRQRGDWALTAAGRLAWLVLLTGAASPYRNFRWPVPDNGTPGAQTVPPAND